MDSFAFFVSGGFVSARAGPLQALRAVAVFLQGFVFASLVAAQSGGHLVELVAILFVPLVGDPLGDDPLGAAVRGGLHAFVSSVVSSRLMTRRAELNIVMTCCKKKSVWGLDVVNFAAGVVSDVLI